jgi:hypothetical protein
MTTPAVGSASQKVIQIGTSVHAQITTSIQSLSGLQAAQLVTPAAPATPAQIVTGNITMIPDSPGFTVIPQRLLSSAVQFDAVRSAANNTAVAYGLNPIYSADAATIQQLTVQLQTIKVQPPLTVESIIIPS